MRPDAASRTRAHRACAVAASLTLAVSGLVFGAPARPAGAAPGDVTTIAGGGTSADVSVNDAAGVEVSGSVLYTAEYSNVIVARDLVSGVQSIHAGTGGSGGWRPEDEGVPASDALLGNPMRMTADGAGNLYLLENRWDQDLAQSFDCRLRRIAADPPHVITTIAGSAGPCGYANAPVGTDAVLHYSPALVADNVGNVFLPDNQAIRRINAAPPHAVEQVINPTLASGYVDGPAANARFGWIGGLAYDPSSDALYVADQNYTVVRKVTLANGMPDEVCTVLYTPASDGEPGRIDCPGGALRTTEPLVADHGLTLGLSPTNELWIANRVGPDGDDGSRVHVLDLDSMTLTASVIGDGTANGPVDDQLAAGQPLPPVREFAFDGDGAAFVATDWVTGAPFNRVRRIEVGGNVNTLAEVPDIGDGGPATSATLLGPIDLARVGNDLYVLEQQGQRIRRIALSTGIITTFVAFDYYANAMAYHDDALYVVGNDARIHRYDLETAAETIVAGTGVSGYVNGPIGSAQFSDATAGLAIDEAGRIYVGDSFSFALRCIGCVPGEVTTVAGRLPDDPQLGADAAAFMGGTPPPPIASGAPATSGILHYVARVTFDPEGRVVFGEMIGGLVRRVEADGTLTTIAGNGLLDRSGTDGSPATEVSIAGPAALRYDADGTLTIGEVGGFLIDLIQGNMAAVATWKPGITKVAPNGAIERYAGGTVTPIGQPPTDGPRLSADFFFPTAITPDAGTHFYVADIQNNRIRRIEGAKPDVRVSASAPAISAGGSGSVSVTVRNDGAGAATGPIAAAVTLPAGLSYRGASLPPGWSCTTAGVVVTCSTTNHMLAGASATLTLSIGAATSASGTKTATIAASSNSDDANSANGTTTVAIAITAAAPPPTPPPTSPRRPRVGFRTDAGIRTVVDGQPSDVANGAPADVPVVAGYQTGSGGGWTVGADGGVFTSGDAPFFGSTGGVPLTAAMVGIAATLEESGYWLVAADGGVFTFGDAAFHGSVGGAPLNSPVTGLAPTATDTGYWLVSTDGGVFTFGDAPFYGSLGGVPLNATIVALAPTPTGSGYWLAAADGGVFCFGDAAFYGSLAGTPNVHIVGIIGQSNGGYALLHHDGTTTVLGE